MKTIYQIIYLDKDGNFHNTNIEFKNKVLGIKGVELEIGNCKELDMDYIRLYECVYDSEDEKVKETLVYEKRI